MLTDNTEFEIATNLKEKDIDLVMNLSESPTAIHFQELNKNLLLEEIILELYSDDIILIDSKVLIKDTVLFNKIIVNIIKTLHTNKNTNKTKFSEVFLFVCDYYNLDYKQAFDCLITKFQSIIKSETKILVGENVYNKTLNKQISEQGFYQKTLDEI